MNSDRTGSGGSSVGALPSRQQPTTSSESEYLTHQAAMARAAMDQTRQDITNQIKDLVDPRTWVNQYPWMSLGTVTALGFLAASAITPTHEETFKHRLRTLFPQVAEQPATASDATAGVEKSEPKRKPSVLQKMAKPLLDTAKTVLVSAISSTIQAKVQQPEGMGNGHAAASGQAVGTA